MADYYRDLVRLLSQAGCRFIRSGRGDHEAWYSPVTDTVIIVDRKCRNRHTANGILKQAGLPKSF